MKQKISPMLLFGGATSLLTVGAALLGAFWTPYNPTAVSAAEKFCPPSLVHLLGTDNFGRDVFSRVLQGMGASLLIAACVVAIGCLLGTAIGCLCGYFGGPADFLLTRLCDVVTAFPSVLLALVVVSLAGRGTAQIILALGVLFIPSFARLVRGEAARCRDASYIQSARLMGVSHSRILLAHILPNLKGVLVPAIVIGFNNAILSEASMSFLGLGVQPPFPSLGSMLSDSQTYLQRAPWYAFSAGAAIALLILGFSLLGEGLQRRRRA